MLSGEQAAAVEDPAPLLAVIAGPGTGKTWTLAHRIAHKLGQGHLPHQLLALSFTNEACNALKRHLARIVDPELAAQVQVFTFHSFCRHLLQQCPEVAGLSHDFSVADEYDSAAILRGSTLNPKTLRSKTRSELASQKSFQRYMRMLKGLDMADYRSLLDYGVGLARDVKFAHVFVDEFQDTSQAQLDILKAIVEDPEWVEQGEPTAEVDGEPTGEGFGHSGAPASPSPLLAPTHVSVFGDPNQAIYGFLNQNFLPFAQFAHTFRPKIRYLSINYRSTQALVEFSQRQRWSAPDLKAHNPGSTPVTLQMCTTLLDTELALVSSVRQLCALYEPSGVAVLTYTNAQLARVMDLLKKARIPFHGPLTRALVDRPNSQAVYALLKYAASPKNIYLLSLIDRARTLISSRTREKLQQLSQDFKLPLLDQFGDGLKPTPKLQELKDFATIVRSTAKSLAVASSANEACDHLTTFLQQAPGLQHDLDTTRLLAQLRLLDESYHGEQLVVTYLLEKLHEVCHANENTVNVRTIHSAKGLEFKGVVMPFVEHQQWQSGRNYDNTMYVGMTRASRDLHMVSHGPTIFEGFPKCNVVKVNQPLQFVALGHKYPKLYAPLVFKRLFARLRA